MLTYSSLDRINLRKNSDENGLECKDPSRAIQSQEPQANINNIVRDFGVTGQLPVGVRLPTYGDFETVDDYQSALAVVRNAEAEFMKLSASVRARFGNDPQEFLTFCENSANREEMVSLGLIERVAEPAPVENTPPV